MNEESKPQDPNILCGYLAKINSVGLLKGNGENSHDLATSISYIIADLLFYLKEPKEDGLSLTRKHVP